MINQYKLLFKTEKGLETLSWQGRQWFKTRKAALNYGLVCLNDHYKEAVILKVMPYGLIRVVKFNKNGIIQKKG